MARRIKLSKNMKPYVGSVSTNGAVQQAFGEKAKGTAQCVASATKGKVGQLSGAQIHAIAKNCSKQNFPKGSQLSGNFIHNGPGARVARAQRRAGLAAGA